MLSLDLGDGLALTPLEPWQAAEFAAFVEPSAPTSRRGCRGASLILDEESARGFLQRYADGTAADGRRIYALRADGRMVGGTLFRIFEPDAGFCEVGVWLAAAAQGRGSVTRAVTAMLDWALLERGLHRAEWHCVPENLASRAVAQRLGHDPRGRAARVVPARRQGGTRRSGRCWRPSGEPASDYLSL